jgi:AbiV family abortive infection protein
MDEDTLKSLGHDELVRGIKLSLKNAESLIEDAEFLNNIGKLARAYTLFQLATEELGKTRLLVSLLFSVKSGKEINYKKIKEEFLHHETKTKGSMIFEQVALLLLFAEQNDDASRNTIKMAYQDLKNEMNNVKILNERKNLSLYVSVIDKKFILPDDYITQDMVDNLSFNANVRLKASTPLLNNVIDNFETISAKLHEIQNDPNYQFNQDFADLILSTDD